MPEARYDLEKRGNQKTLLKYEWIYVHKNFDLSLDHLANFMLRLVESAFLI